MQRQNVSLNAVNLIFRDHLLLEKYNLLSALCQLGLNPRRCWILGKEDASLYALQIKHQLIRDGFRVFDSCDATHLRAIAMSICSQLQNQVAVVVDDGGALIAEMVMAARNYHVRILPIETTTKGIHLLRGTHGGIHNLVDLANSSIKAGLSREIALSCVVRARTLLGHKRMRGEYCHVVGYGKLGEQVAHLLRQMGVFVTVSDLQADRRALAGRTDIAIYSAAPGVALSLEPNWTCFSQMLR